MRGSRCASEVAAGPVGQVVLAALAGVTPENADKFAQMAEAVLPRLRDQLADPAHAEQVLKRVGEVTTSYPYGLVHDWESAREELRQSSTALGRMAALLPGSPATRWWWSPVAPVQWWCGEPEIAPPEGQTPVFADAGPAPGQWWSFPCRYDELLHTTSAVHPGMPVKLLCRDDEIVPERVALWSLTLRDDVRVFEIASPEDWVALVEAYPEETTATAHEWSRWPSSPGGPWLLPDWQKVAAEWDGVHVTIGGYLAGAYRFLPVKGGHTMLAGWAPDETVWLHSDVTTFRTWRATVPDPLE